MMLFCSHLLHLGEEPDQVPLIVQILSVKFSDRVNPMAHLYVASDPNVVSSKTTRPLCGFSR